MQSVTESGWVDLGYELQIYGNAWSMQAQSILNQGACKFLSALAAQFEATRIELLQARADRQEGFDQGGLPGYLDPESEAAAGAWQVREIPHDLKQRRVEITGPVNNAKMVINMLSRNDQGEQADCAMLDFEDSMMPSWTNVIDGFHNVKEAVAGSLKFVDHRKGKTYELQPKDMPVLMVRARGLHLDESNIRFNGRPIGASLVDMGLVSYHCAQALLEQGKTPKFYIPKTEHFLEARWWDQLLTAIEGALDLALGTIRATLLIETLPAAYQMEEILYEIRQHAVALNVGRWDKIFSDIKTLKSHPDRILADRGQIDMSKPWMSNYASRLVHICHRRGALALGGMAAFTPGKTEVLRRQQMDKVVKDKQLEASLGHDGCWVSHPFFIGKAQAQFPIPNQLASMLEVGDRYPDLMPQADGSRTISGLRTNVRVGIAYMYGWQQEVGCVAWDDLMEDLATLEISRAQTWQWLHHGVRLSDGKIVSQTLVREVFEEEMSQIEDELALEGRLLSDWRKAKALACELFVQSEFQSFLSRQSPLAAAKSEEVVL